MIYLDHNATTPLDPEVRAELEACLDGIPGNPSSLHAAGQQARRVIDLARTRVARLIGAQPEEIIFTSGGTEANNLAILGAAAAAGPRRRLVTTAIEHQSVLNPCLHLERSGCSVSRLPVDREGQVDPAAAGAAVREETALVSVMLANNDTGVIQPVAAIAAAVRERGEALVHSDAVQAAGKLPLMVAALGVDLLSFSGHKLHGPQGVGALYVRRGIRLAPLIFGGHQERGLRPGTENVAAIAGFGKACELAAERLEADAARLERLRNHFEAALLEQVPGAEVNGRGAPRLPNTSNLGFAGLDNEALAINLDLLGVAVSTGAACSSLDREPSHVLLAMGRSPAEARSSLRFSFGRSTTEAELARAVELVGRAVESLRGGHR